MPPLSWAERCDLATRFAPHLVLFPEQPNLARPGLETGPIGDYHPRGIGPLLDRGILSHGLFQPRPPASLEGLAASTGNRDQLMLLDGSFPNADHAWQKYFSILDGVDASGRSGRDRYPLKIYAHICTRAEANVAARDAAKLGKDYPVSADEVGRPFFWPDQSADDDLAIQYWFCYYYDDWANQHEGDWEGISLFLRREVTGYEAVGAGYYEHEGGLRRHWPEVNRSIAGGTHPLVYAAAGSHASYFQYLESGYVTTVPGFIIPGIHIRVRVVFSSTRVDRVADDRQIKPIEPAVELLPDPIGPSDPNDPIWRDKLWLSFSGTWGIRVLAGLGYGGPTGPAHKGLKWHHPFAWMERYCSPDFLVY